jgi:glycosyltransferase involved in cell wall biosynthesis
LALRIAYLIVDLEIGGSERVVERIATRLDRAAFTPAVFSLTTPGPIGIRLARSGVSVLSLGARRACDPRAARVLVGALRRFRPHILHAFLFHANMAARLVAPLAGRPAVIATHRTLVGGAKHWNWERLTWPLSDRIVCVSEAVRDHVRREAGVPERRMRVICNGVEALGEVRPGKVVATGVRLKAGKGIHDALRAVAGLAPVRVSGEGPDRKLLQEFHPDAHFTGAVEDLRWALEGAAVFVHASRLGEGMPNTVLEAMACGLPVVATDAGGTREAVVDGETGFLVAPGDVAAIRERVRDLLADRARARRMGRRARERVRELFSVERMVADYADLYRGLKGNS